MAALTALTVALLPAQQTRRQWVVGTWEPGNLGTDFHVCEKSVTGTVCKSPGQSKKIVKSRGENADSQTHLGTFPRSQVDRPDSGSSKQTNERVRE